MNDSDPFLEIQQAHYREEIKKLAELGKKEVMGGKIYGIDININNTDHVIAALFMLYVNAEFIKYKKDGL